MAGRHALSSHLRRLGGWMGLGVLLIGLPAAGQTETHTVDRGAVDGDRLRTVTSHGRRFTITGRDTVRIAQVSRRAEEYAERLEDRVGASLGYTVRNPMRVMVVTATPDEPPDAILAQRYVTPGPHLAQRLLIRGLPDLREEDLLETFVRAFAARLLDQSRRAPATLETAPPDPPRWLYGGLAQSLYSELRARNHILAEEALQTGAAPTLATVLAARDRADTSQRPFEEALCAWLLETPAPAATWPDALAALARGTRIDADWIARRHAVEVGDAETAWRAWLEQRRTRAFAAVRITAIHLAQLEAALAVRRGQDGVPDDPALPATLPPQALVAHREAEWAAVAAGHRIAALQRLAVGKPTAFGEVTRAYERFFRDIARGAWAWTCRRSLRRADAARVDLEALVRDQDTSVSEP